MKVKSALVVLAIFLWSNVSSAQSGNTAAQSRQDAEQLFTYEENDLRGYEDAAGKVVIKPQFPLAWDFSEGLARVEICTDYGYREGFIDALGRIAIQPRFNSVKDFSEGLSAVLVNGKWGFIDKRGELVIKPRFDSDDVHDYKFSEGLAAVRVGKKWGFIDRAGRMVVSPRFDRAEDFSEGFAEIEIKKKHGFIDKTGRVIIKPQFDLAAEFSEGLARVNVGYRFGWNDKDPNRREGKWGYIDKTGKFVIPTKYDWADSFSEGLAVVSADGHCGFIDKTGRVRIEMKYEDAKEFSEGLAAVRLDRRWGYIDHSGSVVIPLRFGNSWSFSGGVAVVNNGFARINKSGEIIWERRPIKQDSTVGGRICEPKIKPPPPTPAELARRRKEIYKLIFKGQYQHDGAGELLYIGDMTSVPALLRILKDKPPIVLADGRRTYICTYAHAATALAKITGVKAVTYEEWTAWWAEYQKSHQKK
ncbi:MAG TPA: WG repeat-containing protein [Pyrinomonadaceae bacterium]|jgi:hypothetical protein